MGEQSQQKSVWFWRESCVKVANNSDYKVSYWVEQECKLKTTAVNETVVTTIQTKLNGNTKAEAGNCITEAPSVSVGARAAKRARKETSVTKEKTEMESYFLLKDYRMEPRQGTPPTTVYFPEECNQLRVIAFFEGKDGQWKSYKDKVYSITNGRKKEFILTALNANIRPYTGETTSYRAPKSVN